MEQVVAPMLKRCHQEFVTGSRQLVKVVGKQREAQRAFPTDNV